MNKVERISDLERKYVLEMLNSQFRSSSSGKFTQRFEAAFASRFGSPYALSFVNGTATMHIALEALGIGPGDEVIVPPLTMSSTTLAVIAANATPVYADVDPDTFQLDVSSVMSCITDRTRAIMPVALYGGCCDLVSLRAICDKHQIFLIEDNAECFLGYLDGKLVGTFGDLASFSFQSSKHLSSGEGGILLAKDEGLANKVRSYQSLGYASVGASKSKISKEEIQSPTYARHSNLGWNYRMPELCCAVALGQVERMDELVDVRKRHGSVMLDVLSDGSFSAFTAQKNLPNSVNSYWTFAGVVREDINWVDFRRKFLEFGGHSFYGAWRLSYLEPMFQSLSFLGRENFISEENKSKYTYGLCPVAESVQPRIVQFKTNYYDDEASLSQAVAFRNTLKFFE